MEIDGNPPKKHKVMKFFGKTSHSDSYRPFPEGVKPMDKIFRPYIRQFEPCRLPFESRSLYDTTFRRGPISFDRPTIGNWAKRDGTQTIGSNEPLDVTSIYTKSYRNPAVHISPEDRALAASTSRPKTEESSRRVITEETLPLQGYYPQARPVTVYKGPFIPYKAVEFNGTRNYNSEYVDRYRDYSRIREYCSIPQQQFQDQTIPQI